MTNNKLQITNNTKITILKSQMFEDLSLVLRNCLLFGAWCLLFVCLGFFNSANASSIVDLTEIGVGARPLGMGKAFNSIADDGSAVFTNPAGLNSVDKFNVISMSGNLIGEVPYTVLGGSYRAEIGVIGFGFIGASVGEIREATLVGGTPEVTGNLANYGSSTLVFSYANEAKNINYIKKINFLTERNAKVGANLKLVSHGFSGSPSFEGKGSGGFDLDLGTIIPINENLTSSFIIKNIIPGNNVGPDELPMGIGGGVAYKMPERKLVTAVDAEINNGAFLLHLGTEWNPIKMLFVRGGLDQDASGINLALGLGTKYRGFTFDYAYHTYAELAEFTTHYFSLGYVGIDDNTAPPKKVDQPRLKLKSFVDVSSGYWAKRPIEYLATANIISGYPDNSFRPDKTLSRAELCTLLIKAQGRSLRTPREAIFPDLATTHWAAPHVKASVDQKLVSGYPDKTFKPNKSLSRAEAVKILAVFDNLNIKDVVENPMPDVAPSHWAAPYIQAAKDAGLLKYLEGKNFEPNRSLSRAEAAEIIGRTNLGKSKIKEIADRF